MRKGFLGSIAALAIGAGSAWGQGPAPIAPAGGQSLPVMRGDVIPASGPNPTLMPPIAVGPPGDPQGLGPSAGIGPPPGPMYPMPGPYGAPMFQPPPGGGLGGDPLGGYGAIPHWWFSGEYLLWLAKAQPVNFPLLTTSAPNQNGVLGQPSTLQLVTGEHINYGPISGARLSAGFFGDADRRFGAEITGFWTERQAITHFYETSAPVGMSSVGIPLLARPFIDTDTGSNSLVVTNSAFGFGNATVSTSTQTWGIEAAGIWNLFRSCPDVGCFHSLDMIAGYKFLQHYETLAVESFTTLASVTLVPIFQPGPFGVPVQVGFRIIPNPIPVGGVVTGFPATVQVVDRFTATNKFHGGVFGLRHQARSGMWSLTTTGKIGVGNMRQVLNIYGLTSFANPATGRVGAAYGGLFANASNIGKYDNDEFVVIPEFTVNVGVNLTKSLTFTVGYNFMWISQVARPANQINPVVDSSTVPFHPNYGELGHTPGVRRLFQQDEFWLQGVNFGLSLMY
jgi:drug/metabolite transporter superfamily protein YnfA